MRQSQKRRLASLGPWERLAHYSALLKRHQRAAARIVRKILELENSRSLAVVRILEDGRSLQLGITLSECTALLGELFPRTSERRCLKELEWLIELEIVRRRRDTKREPWRYVLNDRCPGWVDSPDPSGIGRALLLDDGAKHHPELDAAFKKHRARSRP